MIMMMVTVDSINIVEKLDDNYEDPCAENDDDSNNKAGDAAGHISSPAFYS